MNTNIIGDPQQGMSGMVWLLMEEDGRKIAVKRYSREYLKLLVGEVQNLEKIQKPQQHPNIVRMLSHTEHDITFEYLPTELVDLSALGAFSEPACRHIASRLISALLHLDQVNLVHADLKLHNVMLSDKAEIKLIDFGMSQPTEREDFYAGTEGYMAPEIHSRGKITKKIDVFSLGVCLFQLLSANHSPFQRATKMDNLYKYILSGHNSMFWRILRDRHQMQFSEQFRYLFDGMVEPDPERRFSLLEVLQHPWIHQESMKEEDFALEVYKRLYKIAQNKKMKNDTKK